MQDDERIDRIARRCVEVQASNPTANAELDFMQSQLADTKKSLDNLLTAIENGIITKTTKQRLQELEDMQAKLEYEIEGYKLRAPELNERQITFMLHQMQQKENEPDDEYRERLLDCFVNAVYLYEDKAVVMFNLTSNKATLESVTLPLVHDTPPDGESSCNVHLVEMTGIEPVSEKRSAIVSPGAAHLQNSLDGRRMNTPPLW